MCLNKRWQTSQDNGHLQVFSERPLAFDTISEGMNPSLNSVFDGSVSAEGMAFWADHEPKMNSVISVGLDEGTLANCFEIEGDVLHVDGRVVGRVSSIERNELAREIVVKICFLKRNSRYAPEFAKQPALSVIR